MLKRAEEQTARLRYAADMLLAVYWESMSDSEREQVLKDTLADVEYKLQDLPIAELDRDARSRLENAGCNRTFHWPIEFPEAFDDGGFDAFVGNPPFLGNKYWASTIHEKFASFAPSILNSNAGRSDLCCLFIRRAFGLLRSSGKAGLIGCESLREGDSQKVGLSPIAELGKLYRTIPSMRWPGSATVWVCVVWFARTNYEGELYIDDEVSKSIDAHLTGGQLNRPKKLTSSLCGAKGSDNSWGESLILHDGSPWLEKLQDAKSPFCRQYVTTDDLTSHGFQRCSRWVADVQNSNLEDVKEVAKSHILFFNKWFLQSERLSLRTKQAINGGNSGDAEKLCTIEYETTLSVLLVPVVAKYLLPVAAPSSWVYTNKFLVFEGKSARYC